MNHKFIKRLRKLGQRVFKPRSDFDKALRRAKGVIHIGANTGQERDYYASYGLDVVWVEPIPEVFAQLERNIAPLPKQRAFRYILTDRDGDDIELKIASNGGASSSILELGDHKKLWPAVHYTGSVKMKSTTFKAFAEAERIDTGAYDALVLDTQGTEMMVLKGAGDLLRNFRIINTEAADFEAYVGCCQIEELTAYLARLGFREVTRKTFARKAATGSYYDVLYQRED
jgi:FkbM family methyltransferase